MITANKIGDVVKKNNITLTEDVLYVLDGGEEMNVIKIPPKKDIDRRSYGSGKEQK